jgi:hypothetical protein
VKALFMTVAKSNALFGAFAIVDNKLKRLWKKGYQRVALLYAISTIANRSAVNPLSKVISIRC